MKPVLVAATALALCACRGNASQNATRGDTATAVAAHLDQGVQTAEIAVDSSGYRPAAVRLTAGLPARLIFTRTTEGTCATEIQAADLGVSKTPLPLGKPVAVSFTPERSGAFKFACGMDMLTGTVIVRQG